MRDLDLLFLKNGFKTIAGVDEVGRGALAGPILACAAIIPLSLPSRILEQISDSKSLTSKRREVIFEHAVEAGAIFSIKIIEAEEIDRSGLQSSNLRVLKQALDNLPMEPDICLVDGFEIDSNKCKTKRVMSGDQKSKSIGFASIIAKVTRDAIMQEKHLSFPEYGFSMNKGYGTKYHLAALTKHGSCSEHRMSFRPMINLKLGL